MRLNLRLLAITLILFFSASMFAQTELREKKTASWIPEISLVGVISVVSIAFVAIVACKKTPYQQARKSHHHKRSAVWIGKDFHVEGESNRVELTSTSPSELEQQSPKAGAHRVKVRQPLFVRDLNGRECIVYTDPDQMELRISRHVDAGKVELSGLEAVVFEETLSRSTTDALIDFLENGVEPIDVRVTEVIAVLRRNGFNALPI